MSTTTTAPFYSTPLRSGGALLETADASVGELRDSSEFLDNTEELRSRMAEDGYILLRGFHDREDVLAARQEVVSRLDELGFLRPDTDPMDAIGYSKTEADELYAKGAEGNEDAAEEASRILNLSAEFMPHKLASKNRQLDHVLYGPRIMNFFEGFLGEPAKHFDFTWFRSIQPGSNGTPPHTDVIFMGRAEREQLYTVWTPIGDIDFKQGGLIVLEGSHKNEDLRHGYSTRDADSYCGNKEDKRDYWEKQRDNDATTDDGRIAADVANVQRVVGGRWLAAEFSAGDVLIFSVFTVHGSLDNGSDQIRLSTDSRYQPTSKDVDERWIGAKPQGGLLRRSLIC